MARDTYEVTSPMRVLSYGLGVAKYIPPTVSPPSPDPKAGVGKGAGVQSLPQPLAVDRSPSQVCRGGSHPERAFGPLQPLVGGNALYCNPRDNPSSSAPGLLGGNQRRCS